MIVLLWSALLLGLSVVLLAEQKLKAFWVTMLGIGNAYMAWGFAQTSGVPDKDITPLEVDWIMSGLTLIGVGLVLFGVWFFLDLRRRMPVQR